MTTKQHFTEVVQVAATKAALRDTIAASAPRPLIFERRNLGPVLVSRCPTKPGQWRATTFNADNTPTGHMEAADFPTAVKHAVHVGGDPDTVRECMVAP